MVIKSSAATSFDSYFRTESNNNSSNMPGIRGNDALIMIGAILLAGSTIAVIILLQNNRKLGIKLKSFEKT